MDSTLRTPHAHLVGPALAFVAGVADASTFLGADGIFCAHVTGNFVVLATDLARHARADEWLKLATFPVFVAAVLVSTAAYRRVAPAASARAIRALLAVQSLLLGIGAAVGCVTRTSEHGAGRVAIVALLVTAMGIQNSLHRLMSTLGPMTTVMTGNVTAWLSGVFTVVPTDEAQRRRLLGLVLASFAVGCLVGALGVARVGFAVLVVPTMVTLFARGQISDRPT